MNAGRIICRAHPIHASLVAAGILLTVIASDGRAFGAPDKDDGKFDPLGFPGDDLVVTADVPAASDRGRSRTRDTTATANLSAVVLQVQFFATTSLREARDVKERAQETLKDSVALHFETPYYKLRTGTFNNYDAAETLAFKLRTMGYETAWVVRVNRDDTDSQTDE